MELYLYLYASKRSRRNDLCTYEVGYNIGSDSVCLYVSVMMRIYVYQNMRNVNYQFPNKDQSFGNNALNSAE